MALSLTMKRWHCHRQWSDGIVADQEGARVALQRAMDDMR
jgi:hypothetical protein